MTCRRCGAELASTTRRGLWCPECERAYDTWVRRHASDIVWIVLIGGFVLAFVGMLLPVLGVPWLVAASAAFLGWGTILGGARLNSRRRRRQFLDGVALPRAYLPAPKS
jgi:hypothetical protein